MKFGEDKQECRSQGEWCTQSPGGATQHTRLPRHLAQFHVLLAAGHWITSTLKERSTLLALLQHPLVSFVPLMSLSLALGFPNGKQHFPFACFIQTCLCRLP